MSRDQLPVLAIHETRSAMGAAAAHHFTDRLASVLKTKATARIILGCAPSQDEFFAGLVASGRTNPGLWRRVEVFHMDDYVGLPAEHPESFRTYLREHLLDHIEVAKAHLIGGDAPSPQAEAER